MNRRALVASVAVAPLLLLAACGGNAAPAPGGEGAATVSVDSVRLGVFPNVTHAPGLVGIQDGHLQKALGDDVKLNVSYFNAGGEAIEAIFSGALDVTFIGPNPAINGFTQSNGEAVRIIAGSTSGGAALVVSPDITSAEQLKGKTLASPALGNTQDVALRAWLGDQGYETNQTGGGDVSIKPLANPDILQAFQNDQLDGAWVPEPWATRLVREGGGHVLINEADLWPDGQFVTTHLLVRTEFLNQHRDVVRELLRGHLAALDSIEADPEHARKTTLDAIETISGSRLNDELIADAWKNLTFTYDPIASSLVKSADDAVAAGLLKPVDLDGIYDLTLLNELLKERGDAEVKGI